MKIFIPVFSSVEEGILLRWRLELLAVGNRRGLRLLDHQLYRELRWYGDV